MNSVMIVEDVPEMRAMLEELFTRHGMKATTVGSAVQARGLMLKHRPDWVLLDEILPGESAIDFAKVLHQEHLPVVLMTSIPAREGTPVPSCALARFAKPTWKTGEQQAFMDKIKLVLQGVK